MSLNQSEALIEVAPEIARQVVAVKIKEVKTTRLRLAYKKPFHWAREVIEAAEGIQVEVRTDEGVARFGESMISAPASAVQALLQAAARKRA